MTDQRLRDLERDAGHGDLQARARLLLERVRLGDLTEERLRLAAYLGDEAARVAVGGDAPTESPDLTEYEWLGLARWPAGSVRLALAAAEQVLAKCTEDRAHRAAAIAHRWLADPSDQNTREAADAAWECHGLDWIREAVLAIRSPSVAHRAARLAVQFAAQESGRPEAEVLVHARRVSADWALAPRRSST